MVMFMQATGSTPSTHTSQLLDKWCATPKAKLDAHIRPQNYAARYHKPASLTHGPNTHQPLTSTHSLHINMHADTRGITWTVTLTHYAKLYTGTDETVCSVVCIPWE